MSESYVECMVARRTSGIQLFLKYLLYGITGITALLGIGGYLIFLIVAIVAGVGSYFVTLYTDIEYEYLYLDKEITIDKVLHKSKRKRVGVYALDKIEIMAPIKSYHLDGYKNRQFKELDFSCGFEDKPDKRYVFYYDGAEKIIFEPNEELVKMCKSVAPRKIFTD